MSLNNIHLPAAVLQDLYKRSLINVDPSEITPDSLPNKPISFLGKNEKHIAIVVCNEEAFYLPDEQLNFLLGILSACKLTLQDVAILNIKHIKTPDYKTFIKELKSEKIFLFGVEPSIIELPLHFPLYQPQQFNNQLYLLAPLLNKLQNDKAEKTKLWLCLKQIFSI